MPKENTVRNRLTTSPPAPSVTFATTGNSAISVAPRVQNQLMPRIGCQIARTPRAWRTTSAVACRICQSTDTSRARGGAGGIGSAASSPTTATASPTEAMLSGPCASSTNQPPAMVPTRMATNVVASIAPLPASSSSGRRWSGRMPYFTGPNKLACTPRLTSTNSRIDTLSSRKPSAAAPISTSSTSFSTRISRALSWRSASCPAVADSSI